MNNLGMWTEDSPTQYTEHQIEHEEWSKNDERHEIYPVKHWTKCIISLQHSTDYLYDQEDTDSVPLVTVSHKGYIGIIVQDLRNTWCQSIPP